MRKRDTMSTTKKTYYTIDGKNYRSKALRDYHAELKENKYVDSFTLPEVGQEEGMVNRKYHAYNPVINGITFDSIMESQLYLWLLASMEHGTVDSFERQVTFVLQEGFTDKHTGDKIRPITYIADFVVKNGKNTYVVDVKGKETEIFKLKKKLFLYKFPDLKFLCLRWVAKTGKWTDLRELKKEKRRNAATTAKKGRKRT